MISSERAAWLTNGSATVNKSAKGWPKAFATASQCAAIVTLMHLSVLRHVAGSSMMLFADVDMLLTPSAQGEAPLGLHYTGDHRFQSIWTQLRTPAITLPTHAGPNGMPVGVQLVAPCYADDRLLAMAQLIFRALGSGPAIQI